MSLGRSHARAGLSALAIVVAASPALADDVDDDTIVVDDDKRAQEPDDDGGDPDKPKPKQGGADKDLRDGVFKQDLTGHALPTNRKKNMHERGRFFVDKVDTKKTAKTTLIQGSLTGTQFLYRESGGTITQPINAGVPSNSEFTRLFTDLRLQTDFRHISGGKWDGRVDIRGRFTVDPGQSSENYKIPDDERFRTQSGFLGRNELDLRELWLIRSGQRSDLFFGRQFVPDLAGVKFDGVRVDYATSPKFTLLAFGGLYPIRGSRSLTTDYKPLAVPDPTQPGKLDPKELGRFTVTGGGGAAYRTSSMYGSFGGVVIAPLTSAEQPRVFATSTGYWRVGPKIDFYHFGVLDLLGSNTDNLGITNLSAGVNFKPDQRLRVTASVNRQDTESLNVQAQSFLANPDPGLNRIQNEAQLLRIAQNQIRGGVSAGLGPLQRFEVTTSVAVRFRDDVTLTSPGTNMPVSLELPGGRSVEVYASAIDRRSFKNTRIGVDAARTFRVGKFAYQRTNVLAVRGFASRELASGKGEWEAEVALSQTEDDDAGKICDPTKPVTNCWGASNGAVVSVGGSLFYRVNRNWFGMGSAYVNYQRVTHIENLMEQRDPAILGVSAFLRGARRF